MLVQPVVINYGPVAEWIGWMDQESGINNARRIFARPGSFTVDLHFLDPFDPHDFPGRKKIAAQARKQIEEQLIATLGKPLRAFRYDLPMVGYKAPRDEALDSA